MRVLIAITKQTFRACVRSKVVLSLVALNALAVVLLPLTSQGDGTVVGQLQVSLSYSLRAVTSLVALAAIWVGCSGLSREIEAYNMHLVLTKPAPRWMVWLGKWLGVFLMSAGVFIISTILIYILTLYRFKQGDFTEKEVAKVKSEVLVGRRMYQPLKVDFDELARREYEERLAAKEFAPEHNPGSVVAEIKRQRKAASTGVGVRRLKIWRFTGVRTPKNNQPIFLRYRFYVDSKSIDKQRESVGRWVIKNPHAENDQERVVATPPFKVMSGGFQEISFPADFISSEGVIDLAYENLDLQGATVVFQPADGPRLLIRTATFTENWVRGMIVGLFRLALMAALGCAFGALFSTPVAIFVALAYLMLGAILDPELGMPVRDISGQIVAWRLKDIFSFSATQVVRLFVVSFRSFDVTHALARGYLISGQLMGKLLFFHVILKGGPVIALGIWGFTRRELGKVIRR